MHACISFCRQPAADGIERGYMKTIHRYQTISQTDRRIYVPRASNGWGVARPRKMRPATMYFRTIPHRSTYTLYIYHNAEVDKIDLPILNVLSAEYKA